MPDNRFPSPGVDARFPSPGVDVRFPAPGTDIEHPSPGVDARFEGGAYGGSAALSIGFSASRDEGTTGDIFVAKTGLDTNPGTFGSPKLTIAGAMAIATSGQEIKVRAGTYRETVSFAGKSGTSGNRTTISRYGNEEVIISAAEPLSGFVACTVADLADTGPNWTQMFKVTVPLTNFVGSDPRAAHPYEAGVRLNPATEWLPNPQYPGNQNENFQWHTATATVRSGSLITGYQHLPVTNLYTQAQIENADILFHYAPNLNGRTKVLSFTAGTINLTDQTKEYESNSYKDTYALINIIPAMKKGQWAYKISGSDAILYVWPNTPATINTAIEITRRGRCVNADGVSHVEIRGLTLERAASAGASPDGLYAYSSSSGAQVSHHVIENCLIRENYRTIRAYGPIWLLDVDNWRVERCTIDGAYSQVGMFAQGGDWNSVALMADGGRCLYNVFKNIDQTPVRLFGQTNTLVAFCRMYDVGLAAHANKAAAYSDCHRVTFWGCDWRGSSGYLAWQNASSIAVGFCDIPSTYTDDGRAINDQNRATAGEQSPATEQGISGLSYILNNMTEPYVDSLAQTNAISLGRVEEPQVTYIGKNNILHGASPVDQAFLAANGWRYNMMTSGAALAASAGTDVVVAPADVYTSLTTGDVSIKATSPSRSASTASIASEVAVLQGWYPDYASIFTTDIVGATFNPATPPMGPYVNPDNQAALPPVWVARPTVLGSVTVGATLSLTDGYLIGTPWPSRTYQWVWSADGFQWTNISGATSATYTIVGGDVGRYVGCRITAGGTASVIASVATLVVSSYPVGPPVLLALDQESSGSVTFKNLETPAFTTTGAPILVIVTTGLDVAADSTLTVTLGTAGRSFGTGTTVPFQLLSRNSRNEVQALLLLTPGSNSNQTVQVQCSQASRGTQIAAFEVANMTGLGVTIPGSTGTGTTISPTITTANANSLAFYVVSRVKGDNVAEPVTLTDCIQLSNANTGGVDTVRDCTVAIGYEEAPVAGSYGFTASWPLSSANARLLLELRS